MENNIPVRVSFSHHHRNIRLKYQENENYAQAIYIHIKQKEPLNVISLHFSFLSYFLNFFFI
jgi:hypothetical protein